MISPKICLIIYFLMKGRKLFLPEICYIISRLNKIAIWKKGFKQALKHRRSYYSIGNGSPVSDKEIACLLGEKIIV